MKKTADDGVLNLTALFLAQESSTWSWFFGSSLACWPDPRPILTYITVEYSYLQNDTLKNVGYGRIFNLFQIMWLPLSSYPEFSKNVKIDIFLVISLIFFNYINLLNVALAHPIQKPMIFTENTNVEIGWKWALFLHVS